MSNFGLNVHSIVIRDANEQDLETILSIERDSYADPWGEESFRYLMFQANGIAIVAAQQFPIGYAFGRVVLDDGELLNLAISRAFRNRKVGRAILNEFLSRCWKKGAKNVYLEVRVKNVPAIQLYRSAGFVIEGRRKQYYQDGEDAFIMKLTKK